LSELHLRQLGDQEINIVDIVRPITKYAVMIQDAKKIRYHLEKALYMASHGRPGPVWLDIPLDIQAAPVDEMTLVAYNPQEDEIGFDKMELSSKAKEVIGANSIGRTPGSTGRAWNSTGGWGKYV